MSIVQLPQPSHYWSRSIGYSAINEPISCNNRWEEIKRFIHFNHNNEQIISGQPGHDKLFKIRPLLTDFRNRLPLVPREEHIEVDEQIIPTKGR